MAHRRLQQEPRKRFLLPCDSSALCLGIVRGEDGIRSFLGPNEDHARLELAHMVGSQPAAFQPRLDWSHLKNPDVDELTPNVGNPSEIAAWANIVTPSEDATFVDQDIWRQYCCDLWCLFEETQAQAMASSFGLIALLKAMTYGMTDMVASCRAEITIQSSILVSNCPNDPDYDPTIPAYVDRAKTNAIFGLGPKGYRDATYNKRFFVGLALFKSIHHWVFYIWDRARGHLLIYDTYENNHEERAKALGAAWRMILAKMGTPFTFYVYAMPVTPQRGGWECGYLGLFLCYINLRGLVGLSDYELENYVRRKALDIDGQISAPSARFELRHRDWVLEPWMMCSSQSSSKVDLIRVMTFVSTVILEELGIAGRIYRSNGQVRKVIGFNEASYQRLEAQKKIQIENLFTSLGGFSILHWKIDSVILAWRKNRVVSLPPRPKARSFYRSSATKVESKQRQHPEISIQLITEYKQRGLRLFRGAPTAVKEADCETIVDIIDETPLPTEKSLNSNYPPVIDAKIFETLLNITNDKPPTTEDNQVKNSTITILRAILHKSKSLGLDAMPDEEELGEVGKQRRRVFQWVKQLEDRLQMTHPGLPKNTLANGVSQQTMHSASSRKLRPRKTTGTYAPCLPRRRGRKRNSKASNSMDKEGVLPQQAINSASHRTLRSKKKTSIDAKQDTVTDEMTACIAGALKNGTRRSTRLSKDNPAITKTGESLQLKQPKRKRRPAPNSSGNTQSKRSKTIPGVKESHLVLRAMMDQRAALILAKNLINRAQHILDEFDRTIPGKKPQSTRDIYLDMQTN